MYSWIVGRVLRRAIDRLNAGDAQAPLRMHGEGAPIPDGDIYENEGMEYIRVRWGKIAEQRVYLDTERVADFDARLAAAATA
jgi:ketosteroid isomerase-like protein